MKLFLNRLFSLLSLLILHSSIYAQEVEMADTFRSEGKIYVVVLILSIICIGLFGYLYFLDRKISLREKKVEQK